MLDTPCFPSDASSNNVRFEVDRAFSNHIHDNNNPVLYPRSEPGRHSPHPKHIIMLTADAFGVLPPI